MVTTSFPGVGKAESKVRGKSADTYPEPHVVKYGRARRGFLLIGLLAGLWTPIIAVIVVAVR